MKKKLIPYRRKLTAYILLTTIVTFMVGMYSYTSLKLLTSDMTDLLTTSQELTVINNEMINIQQTVDDYLYIRDSDSLQSFYDNYNIISEYIEHLKSRALYTESGIKYKNLYYMLEHYLEALDRTVIYKRGNQTQYYVNEYQQATKEYNYINDYITQMMTSDLSNSAGRYQEISQEISQNTIINYLLLGITIGLNIVLVFAFSYSITKPISTLASYADLVSKGNFDVNVEEDSSSQEINLLFSTFNLMIKNIKEYVDELKEKQYLKNTLAEEKINSLKMKNALREAELTALQAQINPHFIFNTINIGSRIAMLNGDQVTCEYLEDVASVFRYNLKGLHVDATLEEEIENASAYIKILIMRFGDRIKFTTSLENDKEIKKLKLPRMTLQPLIENAYIHGVSKIEDGGTIELSTKKADDMVYVTISNQGPPFKKEIVDQILRLDYKNENRSSQGHTTGIGLDNVIKRLRLFYQYHDVMEIISNHKITIVTLNLSLQTQAERNRGDKNV